MTAQRLISNAIYALTFRTATNGYPSGVRLRSVLSPVLVHHDDIESDGGFCLPPVNRKAIPRTKRGETLEGRRKQFLGDRRERAEGGSETIYIFNSFPFPTLFRFRPAGCLSLQFHAFRLVFPPHRPSKVALDTFF